MTKTNVVAECLEKRIYLMDLPNKKYIPYICFSIASVLFTISLFIFKPFIKMLELYTLFVRVPAPSGAPIKIPALTKAIIIDVINDDD